MNFMSYVVEFSRGWDEPNAIDMGRMTSQPNTKGEMYILNDGIDMMAKIAAMERRLEDHFSTPLQAMPYAICLSYEHLVDECPTIPTMRKCLDMLSSGCDDRECRVSSWGIRMELLADIPPGCLTSGILLRRHSTRMSHIRNSSPPTFHPDVSHPEFCSADIPPGCLTSEFFSADIPSGYFTSAPDVGWERRVFQLPEWTYPDPLIAHTGEFHDILHSVAVFS
ncbi:hypothetical protein AAG906_013088 [Vitis piasezkii]